MINLREEELLQKVTNKIANIDSDGTREACRNALAAEIPAAKIIGSLSEGMQIIGERFEAKEYFLSELIMAGEIMQEAHRILSPHLKMEQVKRRGKVVIGTVEGDLHDIGKNIVASLLSSGGFEVIDLGVNVPKERFVETVDELTPDVLGLSALLRATVPEMRRVILALDDAGLRHKVKVIVGGLPLNTEYARRLGADYYAENAWKGVEIIKKVVDSS